MKENGEECLLKACGTIKKGSKSLGHSCVNRAANVPSIKVGCHQRRLFDLKPQCLGQLFSQVDFLLK
jgi:hypothetical protein